MADRTKLNEERDALQDEIDRLETGSGGAVKPSLPKVTLQEKSYAAPDDNTLKSTAESELAEYRIGTENSLRSKSAAEKTELESKRDAYADSRRNSESELEQRYADAVRAIDNDVVRRGLARSSVATVERGALEREYLGKATDIAREYNNSIAKLESDIAAVDRKLQNALNDFNLTYAAKLNQRLSELKSEREKKMQEVIEYNNGIKQKQAELDRTKAKTESDLYSAALSQMDKETSVNKALSERRDEVYKAVYKKMDEFLGSLDPSQALLEINNHSFYRQHLSNYYYNRLYDKYGRENRE